MKSPDMREAPVDTGCILPNHRKESRRDHAGFSARPKSVTLVIFSVVFAGSVTAQSFEEDRRACEACHGIDGQGGRGAVPVLAGQRSAYLAQQLKSFRSGDRKHGLMQPIATQLDDARIARLAAHFSNTAVHSQGATVSLQSIGVLPGAPPGLLSGMVEYFRQDFEESRQRKIYFINREATEQIRSGTQLPLGTLIVSQTLELPDSTTPGTAPGKVTGYALMQKLKGSGNSVPALLRNGDWQYALFDPRWEPRKETNPAPCHACHLPKSADEFVFTRAALDRHVSK